MKTRFLTAVVTLALGATMLGGCGKSQEPSPAYEASTGPATYADEVEEEPAISVDEPATSSGLAEVTGENDDFGRPDEGECVEWEEEIEETDDIEGIITLTLYPNGTYHYVDVYAIDETGNSSKNILSLRLPLVMASREYGYVVPLDNPRFGNFQDQFTPDFSKMVATRMRVSDRSMHAGWVDATGEFFDVTEALGEAESSDFDDPVHYHAVGFTDNGETFVYEKVSDELYWCDTLGYYAVSVEGIESNTPWEISPSSLYIHGDDSWSWLGDYMPSDWIDATHFYADTGSKNSPCVIVDVESQTMAEFIPGETRENWGVVSSPDGQQIAFMSRSKNGLLNTAELYVMNLDDMSSNRQLLTISNIDNGRGGTIYGKATDVNVLCTVLDWR